MNMVHEVPDGVQIRNMLVSVSDKTGIGEFVAAMLECTAGLQIYSTGGSHALLSEYLTAYSGGKFAGRLHSVSDYTGQPEMQGGLVKTLDYRIYLGLLSEPYNGEHRQDITRTSSEYFDMVVVNLYPFSQQIARPDNSLEGARSHIDIGGPTMLRASAKNYIRVASVCNPEDYPQIIEELTRSHGSLSLKTRFSLARKSFSHTAAYDAAISSYLNSCEDDAPYEEYRIPEEDWR